MRVFLVLFSLAWIPCLQADNHAPPYPPSPVIDEIEWAPKGTIIRRARGSDNWPLTWADDNHLYGAWGDGGGFGGTNRVGRVGLGVARIEGDASNYQGHNIWGGASTDNSATFDGKSWGMVSANGVLHMWVVPDKPAGNRPCPYRPERGFH